MFSKVQGKGCLHWEMSKLGQIKKGPVNLGLMEVEDRLNNYNFENSGFGKLWNHFSLCSGSWAAGFHCDYGVCSEGYYGAWEGWEDCALGK